MRTDTCDYCGRPVGFYGCPTHGVDCYGSDEEEDMNEDMDAKADWRCEVVKIGYPLTQLIACAKCGVLLWNVDTHYQETHPC